MLELRKIAITGGVASGKTTACRFFRELGAFVVHADAIVHELLEQEPDLKNKIIKQFGSDLLHNGIISRKRLADKVFQNPAHLAALEKLIHPLVLQKIQNLYHEALKAQKYSAFVVEFPLLFEIGAGSFYDRTIAIVADETVACRRFVEQGHTAQDFFQRMKRQFSPQEKANLADYTIINNGTIEDLKKEILALNLIQP